MPKSSKIILVGGLVVLTVLGILIVSALPSRNNSSPAGQSPQSSQPIEPSYGVIQAQHAVCQTNGNNLAAYLDTGQPTQNDAAWGNQRQQVLGMTSGEQRDLFIRQTADAYILGCDKRESDAQAQQAQAAADVQATANRQAHDAQVAVMEKATCTRLAGTWNNDNGYCGIVYKSPIDGRPYNYSLTFDENGNLMAQSSKDDCSIRGNPADPSTHWTWHADTLICAI